VENTWCTSKNERKKVAFRRTYENGMKRNKEEEEKTEV